MFRAVELVRGIHVIADMGYDHLGTHRISQFIVLLMNPELLLPVRGPVEFLHQLPHLLFDLVEIHSLVWHILKFHSCFLFSVLPNPHRKHFCSILHDSCLSVNMALQQNPPCGSRFAVLIGQKAFVKFHLNFYKNICFLYLAVS